jgi:hypothetical protein
MQPFVFVEVPNRPGRSDFPWGFCQKNTLLLLTRASPGSSRGTFWNAPTPASVELHQLRTPLGRIRPDHASEFTSEFRGHLRGYTDSACGR